MQVLAAIFGAALIAVVLWDAFETVILPRRVTRRLRLARAFYRYTWRPWSKLARLFKGKFRESYLGFYGPLSLPLLLGVWAAGLIVGFALLHFSLGSPLKVPDGTADFGTDLYLSGDVFFTLGTGDVTPIGSGARALTVIEGGLGFGFLAIVISYLPVLYQGFSRREVNISMLDARAGSPPTAGELLRRHGQDGALGALQQLLHEWERWSAELLESHLSYPVLAYFRSQHSNESWVAYLATILDVCSLVMVGVEGSCQRQARLTFAMARHAVVDLAQIFSTPPREPRTSRLSPDQLLRLRSFLRVEGMTLRDGDGADAHLARLRQTYEPYLVSLSEYLCIDLPGWLPEGKPKENWQSSAWGRPVDLAATEPAPRTPVDEEEHF